MILVIGVWLWPTLAVGQVVVHTLSVTTSAGGAATVYTPTTVGEIRAIRYVPGASPLDSTADFTFTDNETGLELLTVTDVGPSAREWYPAIGVMTTTGVVALYAAAGTSVMDRIPIAHAIKLVVAQGGASKTGTVYLYVAGR